MQLVLRTNPGIQLRAVVLLEVLVVADAGQAPAVEPAQSRKRVC